MSFSNKNIKTILFLIYICVGFYEAYTYKSVNVYFSIKYNKNLSGK